jgi:hypothetical protein
MSSSTPKDPVDRASVACANCGVKLDATTADIVPFGTGYRCARCTVGAEVGAHLKASAERAAAAASYRPTPPELAGTYDPLDPKVRPVFLEADPRDGDGASPADLRPELLEPTLEADSVRGLDLAIAQAPPSGVKREAVERVESADPYRSSSQAVGIRYICVVCFKAASDLAGTCAHDGAPLSDVENPEVVTMLREHVRRSINRRENIRIAIIASLASVVGIGAAIMGLGRVGLVVGMVLGFALHQLSLRIWRARKVENRLPALLEFARLRLPV